MKPALGNHCVYSCAKIGEAIGVGLHGPAGLHSSEFIGCGASRPLSIEAVNTGLITLSELSAGGYTASSV